GKLDRTAGDPVALEGRVRLISDGRIRDDHFALPVDLGQTAVLRCGQTDLVLTEHPYTQIHPNFFRQLGIEPRSKRILVVQPALEPPSDVPVRPPAATGSPLPFMPEPTLDPLAPDAEPLPSDEPAESLGSSRSTVIVQLVISAAIAPIAASCGASSTPPSPT